jgi:hypothetical protein
MTDIRTPIKSQVSSYTRETDLLCGLFYPAGSSAITGSVDNAMLASAARTGTGTIVLTFTTKFNVVYRVAAQLAMATPDGSYARATFDQSSGVMVVTIKTYNSSNSAADISAASTDFVSWEVCGQR